MIRASCAQSALLRTGLRDAQHSALRRVFPVPLLLGRSTEEGTMKAAAGRPASVHHPLTCLDPPSRGSEGEVEHRPLEKHWP